MSRVKSKDKYLDSVNPRSKKHPRIQWETVFGGTTATGWHSYKEKAPEPESTQE